MIELMNTKGSRCEEQITKRRITGNNRSRVVEVAGFRLVPQRPIPLSKEVFLRAYEEIEKREQTGEVVLRFKNKYTPANAIREVVLGNMPASEALGQLFPVSSVSDPQLPGTSSPRKHYPLGFYHQQGIVEMEQVVMEDAAPPSPAPDMSMDSVSFVLSPLRIDVEPPVEAASTSDGMTLKEAASYAGKKVGWIRGKIKEGVLPLVSRDPDLVSFHVLSELCAEMSK